MYLDDRGIMLLYSMPDKSSICVVITVYNEGDTIVPCIRNAKKLTDSIVVIDTGSTDHTVQQAKKEHVPVYAFPYSQYVEPSRNFALSKAQAEWVFILDADERFSPKLIKEIQEIIAQTSKTHFKVRRNNIFAGKWLLKYGGWRNDSIIRLIKTDAFVNWPDRIHSTPEITGDCGVLSKPLEHHFHPNLENMVSKTVLYENIEAELLYRAGRNVHIHTFFRKFLGELYRRLLRGQGFRDGTPGILESIYQAYSKTITYVFLYEKKSTSL
ncbi:hypothetical protein A3D08_02435 [Candidatus Roizmanbacteria bacterium RIFCSPHIGHO2_02_FULL_43_11]|uniref:Glycosyltransferase 2-like domain-containing protein n=1 Tax=Candidatus Roizmanbacteria bacterium RIFCSPHIGHO2_02_FULL_43_11 TaxID=1802043 RepID=A0A1F7HJS3_9BACT|nr:MAG: hypothetical protein A3D08_02435 [Candidatus Roizmanbacteria bacterium RIFCSPHIGHO2_02_FULL_43_11]